MMCRFIPPVVYAGSGWGLALLYFCEGSPDQRADSFDLMDYHERIASYC